ncbi:MAG: hypothetical protein DWQ04_26325 [Chloroflexi bacterium]|nr:MAG: hypothetical protein DWQ04_26325 [Chloroflexota bacterium]
MNYCAWKRPLFFFIIILLITACRAQSTPEPLVLPTIQVPTTAPLAENSRIEEAAQPPATTQPAPTSTLAPVIVDPSPTSTPPSLPTTAPAAPIPSSIDGQTYRVTFVKADDVLNVRSGPGVDNELVGSLLPTANNVQITGEGQLVTGSTWVPIVAGDVQGWVNGRFLTTSLNADTFCQDMNVQVLLQAFRTAVANQDGNALTQFIHPERGLRIHRHWWNPELRFQGDDIPTLFSSTTDHDWGVADGTGFAMVGPFSEFILPLLQTHFVPTEAFACNEILQGGTAGIVQLPDGYQQQNFYSFNFPGTDEFASMNWGTWVIGIEQWQGKFYVTYLVHFEWEI